MLVALALALAGPSSSAAAAAPASPSPPAEISVASLASGPYRDDALRLAQTVMPADRYIRMLEAAFVNGLRRGLTEDLTLEMESPGIGEELTKAVLEAARPFFASSHQASLLTYARLYSRSLTPAETAELEALFRSPLGQKLMAAKYDHIASPAFASSIDVDKATTVAEIDKVNRSVVGTLSSSMTQDDVQQLLALSQKPVFAKFKALQLQTSRIEAAEANRPDPAYDAAIAAAVDSVIKRRSTKR